MFKRNKISLISKWLPSENSSSYDTKRKAKIIIKKLGYTPREYRKKLSALREYLDVVECKMSSNKWGDIDTEGIIAISPSPCFFAVDKDVGISHSSIKSQDNPFSLEPGAIDVCAIIASAYPWQGSRPSGFFRLLGFAILCDSNIL